jgi:benzoylformate decarboxylase
MDRNVGTSLPGLDFCALARGHGCEALRVERAAELDDALRRAFTAGKPIVVDVLVE